MNLRALMFLGFAGFIAQPALAQTAPVTHSVSFDSVLAFGYEVKTITEMSDAAIKEVFPSQTLASQVFITLQKGASVAVCEMATVTWINLSDAGMKDATRCSVR